MAVVVRPPFYIEQLHLTIRHMNVYLNAWGELNKRIVEERQAKRGK